MSSESDASKSVAQRSARGVAFIGLAKIYFLLIGFAQPIVLTRILGTSDYGLYNSVINLLSILNNVVVAGSIQGMSRAVTESGAVALRRGLLLHAIIGSAVGLALFALAGPIGIGFLRDAQVPGLVRVGAIIAADYTVYAALVGALNGQQRFQAQATLDMTFATLRTVLIFGLAMTAMRVTGAVTGFAIGSFVITVIALVTVYPRGERSEPKEPFGAFARHYVKFFAPVLLYQLAMNVVLQADLLVLKAMLSRRGLDVVGVNDVVAYYKAAQSFAILPYQLLLSVTFVVFPVVSSTTLEGDREATRRFVSGALRFSLLALGAMLAVLVGRPAGVLRVAFPQSFAVGAGALRVLSLGQGAFALGVISSTIILAAGRTRAATLLMVTMLVAVLGGDVVGIGISNTPMVALVGTAAGTSIGCVVGLVAIAFYMHRAFGAFVPLATVLRVGVATAVAAGAIALVPFQGRIVTIALAAAAAGIYVGVVFAIGEVRPEERSKLARLILRRKAA